jgi:DNA-binding transcriptional MocR family regulator
MDVQLDRHNLQFVFDGLNRHEAIAAAFERAIAEGRLAPGERLAPVRRLSAELGVSGATVAAAYQLLSQRGWTRGEVGRGTFVIGQPGGAIGGGQPMVRTDAATPRSLPVAVPRTPWRRRAVLTSAARLRAAHPSALDCTSGKPDPSLLLRDIFIRSWRSALDETANLDLQYATPEPVAALVRAITPRLTRDAISIDGAEMVVGSSAQQLMVLSLSIVSALSSSAPRIVAVEEPGYQTVFDAFERMGFRLVGMEVDDEGVVPDALNSALAAGAQAALFTPRAQNPFGATWTPTRRRALASVLAAYPSVVAIEDDQFADLARARPGSLMNDPQLAERVIYIRSFAKAIAPDIRIAVAVARPRMRNLLAEAKSFSDGWSSRLSQRALAHLLSDEQLDTTLANARQIYAGRRLAAMRVLTTRLGAAGGIVNGGDGLNLWIRLMPGTDAAEVVERAAARGVLLASGEPFFIRPGHNDVIRMSISSVHEEDAARAAERFADAVLTTASVPATAIPI